VIDTGRGTPIVLIPGIQGRWEWMRPAIAALARRHRVISFSLTDIGRLDGRDPFDAWVARIDGIAARAGLASFAVAGVSFGGLVAVRYAATRADRVGSLVLVSTPSPSCRIDARSASYVAHPRLALPVFAVRAVGRLLPEAVAARGGWWSTASFLGTYAWRIARAPLSPARMAEWVRAWQRGAIALDCPRVVAPTLVVTGEPSLDRVVPVGQSLEYLRLIAGSRHAELRRTGHIGLISRPDDFAAVVGAFIAETDRVPADIAAVGRAG
jgi:pimeloyl-ACP methyl ester carboxylesterase